uniref:Sodium/glucose cotransporter 4 n=1 Tax=Plectus sambesii TaxID=2011161 RepID=A0A914X4D7_9BILA
VLVQRVLAAKNFSQAKGGCLFAGVLKILPLFLLVFPGMIARIKYTDEIACTDPKVCEEVCGSKTGCSNIAYPLLVMRLLPKGLRGVMLACMLSALMSSITAVYNSASTIFTMDIWKLIRKNASEVEQLIVGKLFVVVIVVVSILWIPIINAFPSSQLFNYTQSVTSYLSPPVCAVYVAAIFIPRVNEPGAFWALMSGLVIGMARFILEISYSAPLCDEDDTRPFIISKVNYLHFGLFLFVVSLLICITVSFLTPPIPKESLIRLTFQTRNSKSERVPLEKQDVGVPKAAVDEPARTGIKKVIFTVCGLEKGKVRERTTSEVDRIQAQHVSLSEERKWKIFLDVFAVLIVGLAIFLYVYYR